MKTKILRLVTMAFSILVSCSEKNPNQINLRLPEGFEGVIHIYKTKYGTKQFSERHPNNVITISEDGIGHYENYADFNRWHQLKTIPMNSELILYELGEVDAERIVLFYGKEMDYIKNIKYTRISELKPGKLNPEVNIPSQNQ